MIDFRDKVAVVTGGASGIGRAMAERFAAEGMKIVIADVEAAALVRAVAEMKASGADAIGVRTDVSKAAEVEALAQAAVDAFGAVHVLCNNAGVGAGGPSWEVSLADWEWVLGVNLWGVIHGVRTFVPLMLRQGEEAHIVNTASMAGLMSGVSGAAYNVSKHGVVTLSETLYAELAMRGGKVSVSVLCPGFVNTRIIESGRNRPGGPMAAREPAPGSAQAEGAAWVRNAIANGMAPKDVAQRVFEAVRDRQLYILTHPEMKGLIRHRMEDILEERNPRYRA